MGSLVQLVKPPPAEVLHDNAEVIDSLADLALAHRFDLLGSGWVQVRHGMVCAGFEGHRYDMAAAGDRPTANELTARVNPPNRPAAARLRSLIGAAYVPIDWQLDFKSGFRWDEATWYRDVRFGDAPGADIKVPWELGRLQHLPRLALAGLLAADRGDAERLRRLAEESRDQTTDFIASNPPRFGVQWVTAMDVGIRVSNLLLAWDLFRSSGVHFDEPFETTFRASIVDHGKHIAANLERFRTGRGNHYLADLAGLVYVACYLGSGEQTDAWLRFATREMVSEIRTQFLDDGGNFEGSTSYHRLSAELSAYSVALLLALPEPRIQMLLSKRAGEAGGIVQDGAPPSTLPVSARDDGRLRLIPIDVLERLGRAGAFTKAITKPSGRVPQIGDNDNGRFFNLLPAVESMSAVEARERFQNLDNLDVHGEAGLVVWVEDHLDHRALVDVIDGLLGRSEQPGDPSIERSIIAATSRPSLGWARLGASAAESVRVGHDELLQELDARVAALPKTQRREFRIELPGPVLTSDRVILGYPQFGLYLLKSERLYVAFRCGPVGQNGRGGHDHNDQLSIELTVDGVDWIRDPGTYVYTASPHLRNAYRSVRAHFAPQMAGPEPASLDRGVFVLGSGSVATCLYWGDAGFAGRLRAADGRIAYCRGRLTASSLEITHAAERGSLAKGEDDWRSWVPPIRFSPGYGMVER